MSKCNKQDCALVETLVYYFLGHADGCIQRLRQSILHPIPLRWQALQPPTDTCLDKDRRGPVMSFSSLITVRWQQDSWAVQRTVNQFAEPCRRFGLMRSLSKRKTMFQFAVHGLHLILLLISAEQCWRLSVIVSTQRTSWTVMDHLTIRSPSTLLKHAMLLAGWQIDFGGR